MVRRVSLSLVALLVLCASCQKFAEGRILFRELLTLRDELTKEFHEQQVDVNVMDGDRLTVKFINSPLATQTSDVKQKRADDVAAFVTAHYKRPLAKITTIFASASSSEGFVGQVTPKS